MSVHFFTAFRLEHHFFFITAGIKKNRKNMKNMNHNVLGGSINERNERNDKKANALYFFLFIIYLQKISILHLTLNNFYKP